MDATFQIGTATVTTDNPRDTLLLMAGTRLRKRHRTRFEKFKDTFARWNLDGPVVLKRVNAGPNGSQAITSEAAAISTRTGTMRGLPTDADRARLTTDLVREIRALPPGGEK